MPNVEKSESDSFDIERRHELEESAIGGSSITHSPLRLLLIVAISIFLCEAFLMKILPVFPFVDVHQGWDEIVLDAFLLVVLLSPVLYFFLFRPTARHLEERKVCVELLSKSNKNLEEVVEQKTSHLVIANEKLRAEIIERERMEKALRESEEKFRALAENIQDVLWIRTPKMDETIYVSPSYERIWGLSLESLYKSPRSFMNRIHPEDRAAIRPGLEQHSRGYWDFEYRIIKPDGSIRWIRDRGYPISDEHGSLTSLCGVASDITEFKLMEETLRESELKYKTIVENSLTGIFIHQDDRYVFVNDQFAEMHGYKPDELLGKNHYELNHPDQREEVKKRAYRRLKGEQVPRRYEVKRLTKDGRTVFHEIMVSDPIRYQGKPAIMGYEIDISYRKQAEKELKTSEERYRTLIEAIGQSGLGIIVVVDKNNIEGLCIFANNMAKSITGYSIEALSQMSWFDIVDPLYRDVAIDRYRKRMIGKYLPGIYEISIKGRHGTTIDIELVSIQTDFQGHKALVIVFKDVTQQRRAAEEKKLLEERLQQAQKMEAIGTLAGGIAHDFNNILTSIIGYTQLCLEDLGPDNPVNDGLNEVLTAGNRAKDLVQQILSFSRQSDLKMIPIQVHRIIKEASRMLRAMIPTTIDIHLDLRADDSTIIGDATQINQVIMNLCTNAFYAMEENGGRIEIGLKNVQIDKDFTATVPDLRIGNYLKLSVTDTGGGIAPELIDRIFDPYFTTKAEGKGTGLGLSVVHGIVKSHKGHVAVQSELYKGTIFEIYFPLAKMDDVPADPAVIGELLSGNDHILCVEDEISILNWTKKVLERVGYTVTTRTNSLEALEAFKANPQKYDAVITDMTMPSMTGDRLAQEMKKIRPDIPVILCTGYSEKMSEKNAEEYGINEFLMKPVNMTDLTKGLRKVLNR